MKKIVGLLLCLWLSICLYPTVEASYQDDIEESRLVKSETIIRYQPNVNSEKQGVLKKGELVGAVDVDEKWAYVKTPTTQGYVQRTSLATQTGPSVIRKPTAVVDVRKVILSTALVKTYESITSKTIGKLQRGDVVKVKQSWHPQYVWIESPYVSGYVDRKALQTLTPTLKRVSSKSGVSVKPVPNLRPKALVTLPQNAVVQDYGSVGDGWSVVQYGQTVGYVKSNFIGTVKPTKQYTNAHIVLRGSMSHNSEIQAIIPRNIEVQVYGTANGWTYVTVGQLKGYVVAKEVSSKKQTTKDIATGFSGIKVTHSSIKPSIVRTQEMHDAQGQKVSLHFIRIASKEMSHYMMGLQVPGDANIYLQKYTQFNPWSYQLLTRQQNKQLDIINMENYNWGIDYRAYAIVGGGLHEFEELNGSLEYIGNNQYREVYIQDNNGSQVHINRSKIYELDMKSLRFILKTVERDYYQEDYESSEA